MSRIALKVRKQGAAKRLRYLQARAAVEAMIADGRIIASYEDTAEAVIPPRARRLAIGLGLALILVEIVALVVAST